MAKPPATAPAKAASPAKKPGRTPTASPGGSAAGSPAQTAATAPATPTGRKRGGQPGNRNPIRHGLKAGQLPKDAKYIEIRLNIFRRRLEDAVVQARGEVTMPDAAAIQTCLRWERHAALAQRWLNKQYKALKPVELLQFSREVARASTERDRALAALNLDAPPPAPWIAGALTVESSESNGDGTSEQDQADD